MGCNWLEIFSRMFLPGFGNQISTFPDYPAEVRAPQGSLSGVSGFQVHIGKGVYTPGDKADVLVAMNPAALKQNVKYLKPHGVVIVDIDSFKDSDLKKALFETDDPYKELGLNAQVVEVPVSSMVKATLADSGLDLKSVMRCKNMFALGLVCWLFDRPLESALHHLKKKFAGNRLSMRLMQKLCKPDMITDIIFMLPYLPTGLKVTKYVQDTIQMLMEIPLPPGG